MGRSVSLRGGMPPLSFGHFSRRAGETLPLFGPDSASPLTLSHRGRGVNRWRLVGVGVDYAIEAGGAFVDPFGGVGEEEFYAEV